MSGNRFCIARIGQTVSTRHIRRITGNRVKTRPPENGRRLPDVSPANPNPLRKSVEFHTPLRHIRTLRLNLKPRQMLRLCLGRQQKGQNPCSGSQVNAAAAGLQIRKSAQKHCVHSEAEPLRILNNTQSVSLQVVNSLAGTKQGLFRLLLIHGFCGLPVAQASPAREPRDRGHSSSCASSAGNEALKPGTPVLPSPHRHGHLPIPKPLPAA